MSNHNISICLISLGCPKNLVDAEMMLGSLKQEGFSFSQDPKKSQVIVVNTCGFVEESKKESIDQILEMAEYKKTGNCELLIASGCLTQRYAKTLEQEMPEVDAFIGLGEFDRLAQIVKSKYQHHLKDKLFVTSIDLPSANLKNLSVFTTAKQILPDPDLPRVRATPKHFTYLKISEGCSHRCSFCVIPKIRGDLKSREIVSVQEELKRALAEGVKEFNLIAQDLNEYGKDLKNGTSLVKLIRSLDSVEGDFWLRPLYMYPLEFGDELIETLKNASHLVPYIDIPLQHINDRIMRSMKRGSPSRYVRQVLEKLKKNIPDLAIRTTFIVGYPGETKQEFDELYQFVKEMEFAHMGVFKYSQEEDTSAALLQNQLTDLIKQERYDQLMSLQQTISQKKLSSLVGKVYPALFEGVSSEDPYLNIARISIQAPEIDGVTYVDGETPAMGQFCKLKIKAAQEYDLVGEVVE